MSDVTKRIEFYSVGDENGEFSNFALYPIRLEGQVWPTTEHFFQAQKFRESKLKTRIRKASSPSLAARLGRSRKSPLRKDWESVKVDVMRRAVQAKFQQHPELATQLLATGDAVLVECTENDTFWGDGGDGSGRNWLGRILMEVRSKLAGG